MAVLPTIVKSWVQLLTTGTPGVRLVFSTLLDSSQQVAFRLKDFLVSGSTAATKYTVLWTSSGGTGPTNSADHTDRITSAATWTPRATVAAASQAWYVLTGGLGEQILITFQGATDDIFRISFSPGGLFVLAGTTNQQPTATDEQLMYNGNTVVGNVASTDRILHIWARNDAKGFRFVVYRAGLLVSPAIFIEEFVSSVVLPAVLTPPVCGGVVTGSILPSQAFLAPILNTIIIVVRTTVSSTGFNAMCSFGGEAGSGGAPAFSTYITTTDLQAGAFAPYPFSIHTQTTGTKGRVGNLIDMWGVSPTGALAGDGFGTSYQFVMVGQYLMWPNPSNTAPTLS
jgi:hypothetical protein